MHTPYNANGHTITSRLQKSGRTLSDIGNTRLRTKLKHY
jgi:hypothetical protein